MVVRRSLARRSRPFRSFCCPSWRSHPTQVEEHPYGVTGKEMARVKKIVLRGNGWDVDRAPWMSSLHRLRPGQWLNDSIINGFLSLQVCKFSSPDLRLRAEESFMFSCLREPGGVDRACRWRRLCSFFDCDKVLFPIHFPGHWSLACVNLRDHRLEYYDSLMCSRRKLLVMNTLRDFLQGLHQKLYSKPLPWLLKRHSPAFVPPDLPQQDNANDCGVFVCAVSCHTWLLSPSLFFSFSCLRCFTAV